MAKKKTVVEIKFNDVEQEYLLNNKTLPPATLAKALNTTVDRVQKFLDELPKNVSMFDKVIGKSRGKDGKTRSIVMTQPASEIADVSRQKKQIDPTYMHRPKG